MTKSLFHYLKQLSGDLQLSRNLLGAPNDRTYLSLIESRCENLERRIQALEREIKWTISRVNELETIPWIFRDRDTEGLTGYRLRATELANTVSRLLWRKESAESSGPTDTLAPLVLNQSKRDNTNEPEGNERLDSFCRRLAELMSGSCVDNQAENRILVDISNTLESDIVFGIQRVCREFCVGAAEENIVPFFIHDDQLFAYCRENSTIQPIEIRKNETCFWIDAGWGHWAKISCVMDRIKEKNGTNIVLVYDLIPIIYPQFTGPDFQEAFRQWLNNCVIKADVVICISRSVAEDMINYLSRLSYHNIDHIGWSHLGCDGPVIEASEPGVLLSTFCGANKNIFLTVGTIEPRKGHLVALDAFDQLWADGIEAFYVIVGRYGWNAETIRQKITNNSQYGKRLLWLPSANDADLLCLYEHARALVYPSITEGFGLPCVEAASKGCPVIASDIPVFREIGGDEFSYFELCNSDSLAVRISMALACDKKSPDVPILSWNESALKTVQMIRERSYQYSADQFGHFSCDDCHSE